ncbi:MAG TPA: hypothetical protein VD757_01670 [Candidatus Nitrosocosmicus sp.]|nr:hypothetical protein [Candidatus Nitrosocosmicus sp.]
MDSKLMAQILSDAISAGKAPVIVNGAVYKEHRGYINITDELVEAMLYAQRELYCKSICFGSYDCYEYSKSGVSVDGCLVGEINSLSNKGINTIGCCCGHGKKQGYIQVTPSHINLMLNLGYEQLPLDEEGNGEWCFKPKTILP